jgi:glycosyltransferase involved in cell wall biosynthesis
VSNTVTVIIPAYNAAEFLDQALASVAGQSHPADEVIVVDDGSVDASAVVAEQWRPRLPIRVIRHAHNAGLCQARRTGIDAATTDLIALLDADDVWLPDHLDAMLATFAQAPGLVTAKAIKWIPGVSLARDPSNGWELPNADGQLRRILIMNFVFVGTLFARALYDAVGGFRDGRRGAEDWDLWTRMVIAGATVSSPETPTVLYRIHHASMSADDALVDSEVTVLMDLREEVPEGLRATVDLSLRHRRARLALRTAYQFARDGAPWQARRAALSAMSGPRGVRVRAIAVCLAPLHTVRARDAMRLDANRLVQS